MILSQIKQRNITEESNSVLREKEQSITYHYDTFGRLILKDYPNLKDTIYTYGKSTDTNFAGRLIKREDSSGNIIYEYGKLGEIIKETRTLESFINYMDVGQFVTKEFEYKSNYLGQMEEITYPDGEFVTYSYDVAGQVNAITGINTLGDVFEYVKKIGYDEYSQRTLIEYGSGVVTEYSYDPERRWLKTMKSVNSKGEILQNYTYTFDTAGNVTSYINDCLGSSYQTTEQKYTYDALYQLIKVEGECKYSSLKDNYVERDDTYSQVFQYDNIGNLIRKTSADSGVSGKAYTDYLSYDLEYDYNPDYAHRLNKIGRYYYQYDSNGNITAYSPTSFEPEYDIKIVQVSDKEWYLNYNILEGPKLKKRTPSWQRTIFYDDRNQMCEVSDFNSGKQNAYYHYDEDGKRTSKLIWNLQEVLSFGELFSLWLKPSNKWELGQTQKSIMLGNTRLVSKIDSATKGSIRRWKDEHTFYYLSDHIGTANFITTYEGEIYQITEYTPYGERWIERTQNKYNEFYLPYRFAGKPLDEETGWYYFGARYYDPKYQYWTTSDPALSDYFSDTQKGEGGVFNHINLNTYHYAGNNPVKYADIDGNFFATITGAISGFVAGAVSSVIQGNNLFSRETLAGAIGGATAGAIAGVAVDITVATGGLGAIAVGGIIAAGGAVGGAAGSMIESAICGDKIEISNVLGDAAIGAASSLLGNYGGKMLSNGLKSANKIFNNPAVVQAFKTTSIQIFDKGITLVTDVAQDKINIGINSSPPQNDLVINPVVEDL